MTKDEALDLALEALELNNSEWKSLADSGDCGFWRAEDQDHYKQTNEAITAIKQARSAPAPGYCQQCKQYSIEKPLPAAQRQWVEVKQIKWEGDKLIAKLKEIT